VKKLVFALVALVTAGTLVGVAAPAQAATEITPGIASFTASPQTFYPTVRDGFRDDVLFDGSFTEIYDEQTGNYASLPWTITIRNSAGGKVAERAGRTDGNNWDNSFYWNWGGKNQSTGLPVRVGTFKATLTVTDPATGETATANKTLYAKSDTVNKRITKSRLGSNTSARSRTSGCYINAYYYDGTLNLDCWGGRQATARYGFALPSNARNIVWAVGGQRGCCNNGRVIKTGTRTNATHYNVQVRVTNWASYEIRRANVTYTSAVRR